jgi:hypothetical protein
MKNLGLVLSMILMLTGCTTTVTYTPKTTAGPARPGGYPIFIYTEEMKVPRPFEVMGIVDIGHDNLTVSGGTLEAEMKKVMQCAWEKGADAVQINAIDDPGFSSGHYHLNANLLRFTDSWETITLPENEFMLYLEKNKRTLDPIEGIWSEDGLDRNRIGIMKDPSKPGRDFVAFILDTKYLSWQMGYKKIDIARGTRPGMYSLDYYLPDFSRQGTTIILDETLAFSILLNTSAGKEMITYSKDRGPKPTFSGPPAH